MKFYHGRITEGLVIAGLAGLLGCSHDSSQKSEPRPPYFAELAMSYRSGMAMVSGDFDGDGDLDLIVGVRSPSGFNAQLYKFNNDGKGNFSLDNSPHVMSEE